MSERFVSPCPPPTPVEAEILDVLIEEAAEVIQRATKMKRFGVDEVEPGQRMSNKGRLSLELGDFSAMVSIAIEAGLVDQSQVGYGQIKEREKFEKYRQYRPEKTES